jgi:hypothetical protein
LAKHKRSLGKYGVESQKGNATNGYLMPVMEKRHAILFFISFRKKRCIKYNRGWEALA